MIKTKFYDLQLPIEELNPSGSIWYVRVKNGLAYYLLNDGTCKLEDAAVTPWPRFHFLTEHQAHDHACNYYTKHGRQYPFFPEYYKSGKTSAYTRPTAIVDDGSSRVMTFS